MKSRMTWTLFLGLGLFALAAADPPARVVGPGRGYRPVAEQKGKLRIVGSRTLGTLASHWAKDFAEFHPKAVVEVDCEGSETAAPELAKDGVTLGALSRPVSVEELKALEEKTGRKHLAIDVCDDTLAIIVHKENPLPALTRAQVRQLFGVPKESSDAGPATWGQFGLAGDWANRPAAVQLRAAEFGSQTFLRQQILGADFVPRKGDEHKTGKELTAAVASKKEAVGFCRWANVPADVKVAPVVANADQIPGVWSAEQAGDKRHGLKRRLTFLVPCGKDGKPPEMALEFLLLVLSKDGQEDCVKDDFDPLDASALAEQFERLGFDLDK